ncbi:MAG TPA: YebC/PmpR family DNA-binding transcriptional regulator [Candidatus Omnitrophica bacterium]|nr:YebC/PmpR family DNA-binding transcriptional regulator [Candidatus Omnitrophota bacterium]
MSGHSKWANIKHKKGAADAKKGKVFSKIAKEITVAAKDGGDPVANLRLRQALDKAKAANMPSDSVDRAIKRGTGELPGVSYEHVIYECYGPAGVALLIEALTDNKNRTTSEVRNIFSKKGGNMAGAGSVAWMFHRKGLIVVPKNTTKEDSLLTMAIEAGAEDMKTESDCYEIIIAVDSFEKVKSKLSENKIKFSSAEITMLPVSTVKLSAQTAKQVLSLVNELESHDDIQQVHANFDIPDEILEEVTGEDTGG